MADFAGKPIWFELTTPDQDRAQQFYEAVLGWKVATSPMPEHGGYRVATAGGGQGVAGLMTPPPGTPGTPGWTVYFAVDDADAAADRIQSLGGGLHFGPMDIPHVGRFAAVADPQGVSFSILKGSGEPSAAFTQEAGSFGHGRWVELASPDPAGAFAFYGALFGWEKAGAMPMGEMGEYAFIGQGEAFRPGAIMSSAASGAPARWNLYFEVPDIDAAVATAKDRGGGVLQGPDPIPGGDYAANLADAQGFQIGVVGPRKS